MSPSPQPQKKRILLESIIIAVVGVLFGLVANQVSPNGINLTRDYFLLANNSTTVLPTNSGTVIPTNTIAPTNLPALTPQKALENKLKTLGLQLADSNQVYTLYRDPRYAMELVLFIDARHDKDYQEGHVPGAYQLDYYKPEGYLPAVLQVCPTAEQIVVYCNGGDCEDSTLTAHLLATQGRVPKERILIYGGGMIEWSTNGWPVEIGARKSGNIRAQPTTTAGAK